MSNADLSLLLLVQLGVILGIKVVQRLLGAREPSGNALATVPQALAHVDI